MSARARTADVEAAIEAQSAERGMVAHKPWIDKCTQLYTVSTVCKGENVSLLVKSAGCPLYLSQIPTFFRYMTYLLDSIAYTFF